MKLVDFRFGPATQKDAVEISKCLRKESVIECAGPVATDKMLKQAIELATFSWAGYVEDKIGCLWGIQRNTLLSRQGALWLVATPLVEEYPFLFLRMSQVFMSEIKASDQFSLIYGLVRSDFNRSVRWVKWLGFTVDKPRQDGTRFFHWEQPTS